MITLKEIADKLNNKKKIAIFAHIRPDGDALGSAFALKLALNKAGKVAEVLCDGKTPEKFLLLNERYGELKTESDGDYDCYFAVDVSDLARLGKFSREFEKAKETFCVDHHVSNTGFAKYTFVRETASDSENVYELIKLLGVKADKEIASFLLTGIVTDTGAFSHKNVRPETLETAGELMSFGVDLNGIIYNTFKLQSKQRAKLFALTMDKIRYFHNDGLGIIVVTKENLEKTGALPEDTEGFIDFVMSIDSVKVGICLLEMKDKTYKVSFRSKGADVNAMANVYGGGGHVLASGCMINGYLEDVIDKLVYTVKQYTEF